MLDIGFELNAVGVREIDRREGNVLDDALDRNFPRLEVSLETPQLLDPVADKESDVS